TIFVAPWFFTGNQTSARANAIESHGLISTVVVHILSRSHALTSLSAPAPVPISAGAVPLATTFGIFERPFAREPVVNHRVTVAPGESPSSMAEPGRLASASALA